jgi:hypothetical protein
LPTIDWWRSVTPIQRSLNFDDKTFLNGSALAALCQSSGVKFWINCVAKNHVLAAVAEGFVQSADGAAEPMRRLSKDDVIIFYSAGTLFRAGELLHAFTAIGRVAGDAPFQARVSPQSNPWRRRVEFLDSEEASILPVVSELSFITDKTAWAPALKRGVFEIGASDAAVIAAAMKVTL